MSRFRNTTTNIVISVDDAKDDRFTSGWERLDAAGSAEPANAGPFDPSNHTVDDVLAHLATADDVERDRVLTAERDGKARKALEDWTPPTSGV